MAIMSDSSIGLKPLIEEPSKPMPPSKASSRSATLIEKLFSWPRRSVNQRRTKRTSFSSQGDRLLALVASTSFTLVVPAIRAETYRPRPGWARYDRFPAVACRVREDIRAGLPSVPTCKTPRCL